MNFDNRPIPTVKICDKIMGSGKTTNAINLINNSSDEERFIYITPFLNEVERVKDKCKSKNFYSPNILGTKKEGFKKLLSQGRNIVTTHSLFSSFDENCMDLVLFNNYTLILDEVANVVEPYDEKKQFKKSDLKAVLTLYADIDPKTNLLIWREQEENKKDIYDGRYDDVKNLCKLNALFVYNETAFLWMFPIKVFKAFKDIYILTYLFEAQMQSYYYKFFNVPYKYIGIKGENFCAIEETEKDDIEQYAKLISIYNGERLNAIGQDEYSLSASWYKKSDTNKIRTLRLNTINFFNNISKTPSSLNMWVTFKQYNCNEKQGGLRGKGYSKGFVSLGTRATNQYIEKSTLAYLTNTFMNPIVKNFFLQRNIEVHEDLYALSEFLQWMFRSRIRRKESISLYLPSSRMRRILQQWLDNTLTNNKE